jgi:hypothetical protein
MKKKTLEKIGGNGYAENMTLYDRNSIFKAGIVLSVLCLVICIAGTLKLIPAYASMEEAFTRRSGGIFQALGGKNLDVTPLSAHFCIFALVLYSFFSIIFIYYFFEKTQSPEILFMVFFAVSFSVESLRLVVPLRHIHELPSLYLILSSRAILFGRFFGLFSLFAASLYAVGYEAERQRNVIMVIIVVALVMALGVPIDTQDWDSSLNMSNGFISMFRFIEIGILIITAVSFFIAVWKRGSREFAFIGIGSILAFLGRNILLSADTWAALPAGLVFLAAGTWLICTRLHKIYLWL